MRSIQNKHDGRYIKKHKKIRRVFLENRQRGKNNISVTKLCEEVGIHSSTLYDHYANIDMILDEIEENLYKDFLNSLDGFDPPNQSLQKLQKFFRKLLTFINQHQPYFRQALTHSEMEWFLHIFNELKPFLVGNWRPRNPKVMQRWFNSLCFELIGIIYDWGKNDKFDTRSMSFYYCQLAYITHTSEMRFRRMEPHITSR